MSQQTPAPTPPPTWRERTQNFLLYGFAISVALHLIVGPFIKFERAPDAPEKIETVKIDKMPTPPPTPKPTPTPPPTPTPKPTQPPTPPPTQPPKSTPPPPQPKRIKINTAKTEAKPVGGPVEDANKYTQGAVNGVPNGSPTGVATQAATAPPTTAPTAPPPTPRPTPTPLACANPNVPAKTINTVQPDTPSLAQQQGISGEVTVLVSLDENSKLVGLPTVQKSPSALLNKAAIDAARQTTYQTEIRNCKPIAATYRFIVEFTSQ